MWFGFKNTYTRYVLLYEISPAISWLIVYKRIISAPIKIFLFLYAVIINVHKKCLHKYYIIYRTKIEFSRYLTEFISIVGCRYLPTYYTIYFSSLNNLRWNRFVRFVYIYIPIYILHKTCFYFSFVSLATIWGQTQYIMYKRRTFSRWKEIFS